MPAQYRAIWDVPGGGTGYSVLHFTTAGNSTAAQLIADHARIFFNDLSSLLPDDVDITFDPEVLDLSEAGVLISVWPVTPPSAVAGSSTAVYSRAAGGRVDWATDQIVSGRRLSGRTYVVPLKSDAFTTTGELASGTVTTLSAAAATFIGNTSGNRPLRVFSRTHGVSAVVTDASVPLAGAILRGRRD